MGIIMKKVPGGSKVILWLINVNVWSYRDDEEILMLIDMKKIGYF